MIQVAFAGHNRPDDLGHHDPVIESLDMAMGLIRAAGVSEARLLTGLAEGADVLAARAWRKAGLGPVQAVYPHLTDRPPEGCTDCADVSTWLDGAAAEAAGRNPHLKQTRLIVEAADLLVCVWTGDRARGAGGTADAVRTALQRGIPILWIKPAELGVRLIRADTLPADFYFLEFQEALQDNRLPQIESATAESLSEALSLAEPPELSEREPGGWQAAFDNWLHGWLWQTYRHFRNFMGGKVSMGYEPPPVPTDLAAQPGFQKLSAAYDRADRLATRLASVHRSEQILLVMVMIVAAVIGSAWAIWPQVKYYAVWAELILGVSTLMIWSIASDSRQHEMWGLERYMAEQLRLARAGWAVGVSAPNAFEDPSRVESDVGRQVRQSAGLPIGPYDAERAKAWGEWAMGELVQGQSAYHRAISTRDHRIAHRIHFVEDVSFLILFILFVAYITLHITHLHTAKWFSGLVAMTGVVVPALAAAAVALEAKLEFSEQSARSTRIAAALDVIASRIQARPTWEELQLAVRQAMAIHIADARHWLEGAGRRRLLRP